MRRLAPLLLALAVASPASAAPLFPTLARIASGSNLGLRTDASLIVRSWTGIEGTATGLDQAGGLYHPLAPSLCLPGTLPAWQSYTSNGPRLSSTSCLIRSGQPLVNRLLPRQPLLAALRTRVDPDGWFTERIVDWIEGLVGSPPLTREQRAILGLGDPEPPGGGGGGLLLTVYGNPWLLGASPEDPLGEAGLPSGSLSEEPLGGPGPVPVPEPATSTLLALGLALLASLPRRA